MDTLAKALSLPRAIKAASYAAAGLRYALYEPAFARIVIVEAILAGCLSWYLWPMSGHEAAMILMAGVLVPIAELNNTSIEELVDMVEPEWDVRVKKIKDRAAGATMLAVFFGLVICTLVVLAH